MSAGFLENMAPAESEVDIGLTPLIDVVFQLLVFFMLTSTFAAPALELMLPEVEAPVAQSEDSPLMVELDAEGQITVNGTPADQRIAEVVRAVIAGQAEVPAASLRADRATPYERVTQVMHALSEAGIAQINFVYEVPQNP